MERMKRISDTGNTNFSRTLRQDSTYFEIVILDMQSIISYPLESYKFASDEVGKIYTRLIRLPDSAVSRFVSFHALFFHVSC